MGFESYVDMSVYASGSHEGSLCVYHLRLLGHRQALGDASDDAILDSNICIYNVRTADLAHDVPSSDLWGC